VRQQSTGLFLAALITLPITAFAESGTIVLNGKGSVSAAPEYVSFGVSIKSICYDTSQEAAMANAKLANDALKVLEGFKKSDHDKVTASGGANVMRTETTQVGNESHVLCEMKWHAENYLEIQMADIGSLPDLQDRVVNAVNGSGSVDRTLVSQTYAESSKPQFGLYPETSKRLRDVAPGLAFDDGKSQLEVFRSHCGFVDLMLVSITPEFTYQFKLAGVAIYGSSGGPVIPDELEITSDLKMQWAFTPSVSCRY
jgi:hypothetical protein